ncbi:MAG: DUF2231 domain-containing protein [Actinomycetota bacterium]
MNSFLNLFRGFGGHPAHPPLTDASIGAYTAGTALVMAGWLGFMTDKFPMVKAGFLAIAVGLIFAVPTVITGFADYFSIPRGNGMRRTANIHWLTMATSTGLFLLGECLLKNTYDTNNVTTAAGLTVLGAFALLTVGGYVGGAIVFEYGMRVRNTPPETPASEALKPKWPPTE